jgi:hypothetical protein
MAALTKIGDFCLISMTKKVRLWRGTEKYAIILLRSINRLSPLHRSTTLKKNTHKTQPSNKGALTSDLSKGAVEAAEVDRPLTAIDLQTLDTAATELGRLDKVTTAHTFERGRHLAAAKALLPKKAFGKWLNAHTAFSVRHAWNHILVDKNLSWHRKRCEAASIVPTTLFILATSEDQRLIEDVIASFDRGDHLTGARIKEMIALSNGEATFETVPMNVGGVKGFLRLAEMRAKEEGARFDALANSVLAEVETAAATIASGKNVTKQGLASAIEFDARHAHDLLKVLISPMFRNDAHAYLNWHPGTLPKYTSWGAAQTVLERLGGKDNWPGREEFPGWLTNTVLPVLRFIVRGEELPGFEAKRLIEPAVSAGEVEFESAEVAKPGDRSVVEIDVERRKRHGPDTEAA